MRSGIAAALIVLLAGVAPAAAWQPAPDPPTEDGGLLGRIKGQLNELSDRAKRAMDQLEAQGRAVQRPRGVALYTPGAADGTSGAAPDPGGWTPVAESAGAPAELVILIHGLDEPGSIWDTAAPMIAAEGHALARFDYPNDQPIAESAVLLADSLRDLRVRGVTRVTLVGHSMGGLVARDALTRPTVYAGDARGRHDLPDVVRLITIGTPNGGSPWAKLRAIGEVREQIERFFADPEHDWRGLMGYLADGLGEAGDDLLPGSEYLTELNSRPLPSGVAITVVAGCMAPVKSEDLLWLADSWVLRQLIGASDAGKVADAIMELATDLGDGVVPMSRTTLDGVEDVVCLDGFNHRTLLKPFAIVDTARELVGKDPVTPAAIPVILDRLSRPAK